MSRLKTGGFHKYLNLSSFKNYIVDSYKEALKQLDFPELDFQKIMTVIDKIATYRNKRIKGNTQKCFDSKVLEKLNAREKLF